MAIKADFTPVKKTLFIKQFSKDGVLMRKRVVKGDMQFDTCFTKTGERWETLATEKRLSSQILNHAPHKMNFVERMVYAILRPKSVKIVKTQNGYFLHEANDVYPNYKTILKPLERKLLEEEWKMTGFTNPQMNAAEKEAWKKLMFR